MPVVTGTMRRPAGASTERATVTIRIVGATPTAAAFTADGDIFGTSPIAPNGSGAWSATLIGNADITPAGTQYEITEAWPATGEQAIYNIVVPSGGGPYDVKNILAD